MELREYIRVLVKGWWIILPLTLLSLTAALFFSYAQTPVYEAISTYVTRLDASLNTVDLTIYGLDTLTGRQRIFVTYCEVMKSQTVLNAAYRLSGIDLTTFDPEQYEVFCNVLPDTNVIMLIVQGPSPVLASRLNQAIGLVGSEAVNELYSLFPLESLDPVLPSEDPISPDHMRNGLLGGILGLALGVTAALLLELWRSPRERLEVLSIRDPMMGVYNRRYFQRRFSEEINRAHARNRPISVALLRLVPNEDFSLLPESIQEQLLRGAALRMEDTMRQGDIIAHMGRNTFGILLAETPGDEARAIVVQIHKDIRSHTFQVDDYTTSFVASTGLVESSGGAMGMETMLEQAAEALRMAEQSGENTIQLVRASPRPFLDQSNGNQPISSDIERPSSLPFDSVDELDEVLEESLDDDLWKDIL